MRGIGVVGVILVVMPVHGQVPVVALKAATVKMVVVAVAVAV
jgi:hypothetical protein